MSEKTKLKQPKKPTEEKKLFLNKLEQLKGIEFENLQDFIIELDKLD